MLTTGSVWQVGVNRALGAEAGFSHLTAEDVKLALQGLPQRPFLFGMAAFMGDFQAMERLADWEHLILVDRANQQNWPERRGQRTLRRLVSLALYETIGGQRCPACLGRGRVYEGRSPRVWLRYLRLLKMHLRREKRAHPNEEPGTFCARRRLLERRRVWAEKELWAEDHGRGQPCYSCHESGRIEMSEGLRARLAQIPRRTWYRGWDERYAEYLCEVQRLEWWAIGHVKGRLRRTAA